VTVRVPASVAWALIAVAIPVALTWMAPTQALDLAYQIRAGEGALDHAAVPRTDTFTYTMDGQPWFDQQWGAQVLLGSAFRVGGWAGLDLLRGALVGLTVWFVYAACRSRGAAPMGAALLALAGWAVAAPVMTQLRPQLVATTAVAAVVWVLASRAGSPGRVWCIPLLTLVVVNLHGSFPIVLVLLGLALLEDRHDRASRRRLVGVGALSLLATALTPFGPSVWAYVVELATDPVVAEHIGEWAPPSLGSASGVLFVASVVVVAGALLVFRRGVRPIDLVELAVFAGASAVAVRAVVWWAIVAPVVIAGVLVRGTEHLRDDADGRSTTPATILAAVCCVVAIIAFVGARGVDERTGAPRMLSFAPEDLVAVLRDAAPAGSNVFASQLHASWAELSAPGFRYMVDSRVELFPAEVWDDYFRVSAGADGWEAILDRADVGALLLEADQASGLREALQDAEGWRRVTETDAGAVYVRDRALRGG